MRNRKIICTFAIMSKYKSPYRRGADEGFLFGLYLIVLFLAMTGAERHGLLGLVTMVLAIGVPFIIYALLRRTYRQEGGTTTLSSLWMQGIMIFLCGSMLSGVVAYIYMRYIDPSFLLRNARSAIEVYESLDNPSAREIARGMETLIEHGALPTPIQIVFQSIWSAVLSGSLLSLVTGLIVRSTGNRRLRQANTDRSTDGKIK